MVFNRRHLILLWQAWQVQVLSLVCNIFETGVFLGSNEPRYLAKWFSKLRQSLPELPQVEAQDCALILVSGLFEIGYYSSANPDVPKSALGAARHYCAHGGSEGRAPSPNFDSALYLSHYPDIKTAGANPLLHFIKHGAQEGRVDAISFDRLPPPIVDPWNCPEQNAEARAVTDCISVILRDSSVSRESAPLSELRGCLDLARSTLSDHLAQSMRTLEEVEVKYYTRTADFERCMSLNDELMNELSRARESSQLATERLEDKEREVELASQKVAVLMEDIAEANGELAYWRRRALSGS